MKLLEATNSQLAYSLALRTMNLALAILDELDAPAEVASHLGRAICRVEQHLEIDAPPGDGGGGALYASLAEELLRSSAVEDLRCPWSQTDVAQCRDETTGIDDDHG